MGNRSIVLLACLISIGHAWFYGRPEPDAMTHGEVWPLPQSVVWGTFNHTISLSNFDFVIDGGVQSPILLQATSIYKLWTFPIILGKAKGTLTKLRIRIAKNVTTFIHPKANMDEHYTLTVTKDTEALLEANEIWGALRGLETFSQLVFQPTTGQYALRSVEIKDFPRFAHRGVLLDTARHFIAVSIIHRNIELMAQNKLNVLHWHVVDDESFPYSSAKYPDLSSKGAYTPRHRYTVQNVKHVVEHAASFGIRVIAEFGSPTHMGSWNKGMPGMVAKCFKDDHTERSPSGTMDPSNQKNYDALSAFFTEAGTVFPDEYLHFGGDEMSREIRECWQNNANVSKWMQTNKYADTTVVLQKHFDKLAKMAGTKKMIVWQGVVEHNVTLPGATVEVLNCNMGGKNVMSDLTLAKYNTIFSACWHLDQISYADDWRRYYTCEPTDFTGSAEQKKLVLGGEVLLWGQFVDGTNIIPRLWPRASAAAERLWSSASATDPVKAWPRLHEHRCRMTDRHYEAQPPNNPDFCPRYWEPKTVL